MLNKLVIDTDSYITSHYLQYPSDMKGMYSYLSARGRESEFPTTDHVLFFGLKSILTDMFSTPVTEKEVESIGKVMEAHGVPFPKKEWLYVARECGGLPPVTIKALPEGSWMPLGCPLMTVESTDPVFPSVVGWLETALTRCWYPSTIATHSALCHRLLQEAMEKTSDSHDPSFKLHDFGARGTATRAQAAIGGSAHLISFLGTDTLIGLDHCEEIYQLGSAGYSIPAAAHCTVGSWGEENEADFYEHFVQTFLYGKNPDGKKYPIAACVSDAYDYWRVVKEVWASEKFSTLVKESGGTLVIRPDSGDPALNVIRSLHILGSSPHVGYTVNSKGFKVLAPHYRIIQGDGIDYKELQRIVDQMISSGWALENVAFGSGGALLQKFNRDTLKFAYKCSSILRDDKWTSVYKNTPGKASLRGRVVPALIDGEIKATTVEKLTESGGEHLLRTIFSNVGGQVYFPIDSGSMNEIRFRAMATNPGGWK
jgi:nicotinamide phosphoribosyltransferase